MSPPAALNNVPLVYVVGPVDGAVVKIGHSVSFPGRFRSLRADCPIELVIHGVEEHQDRSAAVLRERGLHRRFARERLHHEWFRATPRVRAFITQLRTPEQLVLARAERAARLAPPPPIEIGQLLTPEQAAQVLQCSTEELLRRARFREVPFYRVGRQFRFASHELTATIDR